MNGLLKEKDYFSGDGLNEKRIGKDLILLGSENYWNQNDEPYLASMTNAIFFTRGSADISINMTEYHIEAPCMVILMEGMIVQQKKRSANSEFDVVILSASFTDAILSDANVSIQLRTLVFQNPVFPISGDKAILKRFHYLLKGLVEMKDNPYRLEAVKHMTLTLFCGFALSRSTPSEKSRNRKVDIMEDFLALVKDNYRQERKVSFYADKLCITPKYLSQVVKDVSGKPALDWIDDFTITETKALLKSTALTIEQISTRMNFMSTALFGKFFKRITGLSPRQYRNSAK